jgi:hypothetical protein
MDFEMDINIFIERFQASVYLFINLSKDGGVNYFYGSFYQRLVSVM